MKTRRFSLSSAFNKSRRDVLRSTVIPHPPLPAIHTQGSSASRDTGFRDGHTCGEINNETIDHQRYPNSIGILPDDELHNDVASEVTYEMVDVSNVNAPQVSHEVERKDSVKRSRRKSSGPVVRGTKGAHPLPDERHDGPSRRRSIGFSLTQRAFKGQSLPAGRLGGVPPVPSLPKALSGTQSRHGWEGINSLFRGLHPDKDTKEQIRRMQLQRSGSSMGCAEYDPNLVLDAMSFAQTSDIPSSTVASTDHSDRASSGLLDGPVHALQMSNLGADSTMNTEALARDEEADDIDERYREDRDEERGFLRALGLEFDAIARRVEQQV